MRVTSKGQVTIPHEIRERLGIRANTEVDFVEDRRGRFYLRKSRKPGKGGSRFRSAAAIGRLTMSTDEIMALTRGD